MSITPDEWQPRDIASLEPAAWDAIRAGTSSVTAGPGAGKTEFLAQRASYLFETGAVAYPRHVLAISFKRSSAVNLRDRVRARTPQHAWRFTSLTFEAFAKSIVDRFASLLPSMWSLRGGYRVGFSSRTEIEQFLDEIARNAPAQWAREVHQIPPSRFLTNAVGSTPLPVASAPLSSAVEWAVAEWWRTRYTGRENPTLDFVMINRLAELIVRSSPQLHRALTATYPYIFVDEFQDTTLAQYDFLESVFNHHATQITVVGDRKQRIMGWAGALPDAFEQFDSDFSAESFTLTSNHRSSPALVGLQHRFAQIVDPDTAAQISQTLSITGDAAAQVWSFSSSHVQAQKLAEWIADDVASSDRNPSDHAILVRQRAEIAYETMRDEFESAGLRLRNDDAIVGSSGLRLQEVLADDLVTFFISLIRLASSTTGEPDAWRSAMHVVEALSESSARATLSAVAGNTLTTYITHLRKWIIENAGEFPRVRDPDALATRLLNEISTLVNLERIAESRVFPDSRDELALKLTAMHARLAASLTRVSAWRALPDEFMDVNAVPLMTIHRSKGLEYHSVYLLGLDDDQWWAHARDTIESTMTFFVGVSRAAERLIFTHVRDTSRRGVDALYEQLAAAGVPTLEMG